MSALAGFRALFSVAGVRLPVISFLARLPAEICPIGTLLMLTELDGIEPADRRRNAVDRAGGGRTPLGRLADRRGTGR
ncbi:hypothetical protein [Streptomyces sp. NPDC059909]|uniref:hypothetical protein n=1 Tax=Streptomyces sp. NPDC059909 TaxID=3346998 RepID=UPI003662B077